MTRFESLNKDIIACERCPRLRQYCLEIARVKKRAYREFEYWGRPVPNFGDPKARLLVVGPPLDDRVVGDLPRLLRRGDLLVFNDTRVIPVGGPPHVAASVQTWDGDARGHWDGDTLVVDSTNFKPGAFLSSWPARELVNGDVTLPAATRTLAT